VSAYLQLIPVSLHNPGYFPPISMRFVSRRTRETGIRMQDYSRLCGSEFPTGRNFPMRGRLRRIILTGRERRENDYPGRLISGNWRPRYRFAGGRGEAFSPLDSALLPRLDRHGYPDGNVWGRHAGQSWITWKPQMEPLPFRSC
jgi:hypothetical protein